MAGANRSICRDGTVVLSSDYHADPLEEMKADVAAVDRMCPKMQLAKPAG